MVVVVVVRQVAMKLQGLLILINMKSRLLSQLWRYDGNFSGTTSELHVVLLGILTCKPEFLYVDLAGAIQDAVEPPSSAD